MMIADFDRNNLIRKKEELLSSKIIILICIEQDIEQLDNMKH